MKQENRILIRESFDCSTYEKDRQLYRGKLLSYDVLENKYSYAFKIDELLLRMNLVVNQMKVTIIQNYPDAEAKFVLEEGKRNIYEICLNTGHKLCFMTETEKLEINPKCFEFKFRLLDEKGKDVISFNEIKLTGDEEIC